MSPTNNKILNTLLTAELGRPGDNSVLDFGDPGLERGIIPQMLASPPASAVVRRWRYRDADVPLGLVAGAAASGAGSFIKSSQ